MMVLLSACGANNGDAAPDTLAPDDAAATSLLADETTGSPASPTTAPEATAALDPADLDWEAIYRELVAREQAGLVANDLEALASVVTGRWLETLSDRVELYRYRGYTLDDTGVERTVDTVELAEVVEDDHVVLHVTETRYGPEVVRAADGSEVRTLSERTEQTQRIQVDVDLVDGEWRTEHHYYMGTVVGIEPLPAGPPTITVSAEGHTLDLYSWSSGDDLECIGFDGTRPDGTGIGDWTQCEPLDDVEPQAGTFVWQVLPMAGDDAPLVYFAFGSVSLDQPVELDGRPGDTVERPNGGPLSVWLQSENAYAFEVPGTDLVSLTGRLGITECGETRPIGRYPPDLEGGFDSLADIADAVVERLRDLEWQAGSVEVNRVNLSSFVIWAEDVDHATSRYVWAWTFDFQPDTERLLLETVEETRLCR